MSRRCTLLLGDCLERLRAMPDASVDAIVTDPPAGIGFMGKGWDSDKGGRDHWIAWLASIMREALRVLRPGGHALVWALPRTSHWTATAIEDAGFEIRDVHHHIFGCLTDDVDVLTPTGWRRGVDIQQGDIVAQWDASTGSISLSPVERTYRAPWDGDLVRLVNADTDQALTPNHRVFHRAKLSKEWSEYRPRRADEISRRSPVRLPLAGEHDGPGIGGEGYAALLGWVWTEGGFDPSGTGVRVYQSSVNGDKVAEIDALLDRLGAHKRYSYERTYESRRTGPTKYQAITWFMSGDLALRVRRDLPGKHPTYDLLWQMTLAEKRAFLRAALLGDGSASKSNPRTGRKGGSLTLEQKDPRDREWFVALLSLVGWRGHDYARKTRDGGSVSVSRRADTTISTAGMKRNMSVHYRGDVWCIGVPSGAFVARRNGKVFITGNSGFPKSLDVSKAHDKRAGAKREVLGPNPNSRPNMVDVAAPVLRPRVDAPLTAPSTPAARRWSGYGTALKPAVEHWILARRPLEGTYAENVLAHGTGALNVDGCRIGQDWDDPRQGRRSSSGDGMLGSDTFAIRSRAVDDRPPSLGRWPAHLSLEHAAGCRRVGETVEDRPLLASDPIPASEGAGHTLRDGFGGSRAAGTSPVTRTVYDCVEGCPVRVLDEQSGGKVGAHGRSAKAYEHDANGWGAMHNRTTPIEASAGGASRFFLVTDPGFRYVAKPSRREKDAGLESLAPTTGGEATGRKDGSAGTKNPRAGAGRTGGARNQHPTVKPVTLMRWLVRLITPPGGLVLDPFAGSGTTGVACADEGMRFLGIEQDEKHHEIARLRLRKAYGAVETELPAQAAMPAVLIAQPRSAS